MLVSSFFFAAALHEPVKQAVGSSVSPIPAETALQQQSLPEATPEETAAAKEKLQQLLQWRSMQQHKALQNKSYEDFIDLVFGLSLQGLEELIKQEIINRKSKP